MTLRGLQKSGPNDCAQKERNHFQRVVFHIPFLLSPIR
jgi:hypothetical protein